MRYDDAYISCDWFFVGGLNEPFNILNIIPSLITEAGPYIKLNNFKKNAYYAGVSLSVFFSDGWDHVTGYIKYIDSNGKVAIDKGV